MIEVTVIDREGEEHLLEAPTDMGLNMMEVCKSYELPVEGTCGGWPCVPHVTCMWNPIMNCLSPLKQKKTC